MFRSLPAPSQAGSRYPEKDCPISYLLVKPWLYSELVAKRIGYRFSLHPIVFPFSQLICTCSVPDRLKFRAFLTDSFQNLNLLSPVWRMGMVWEAFIWLHQLMEGIMWTFKGPLIFSTPSPTFGRTCSTPVLFLGSVG